MAGNPFTAFMSTGDAEARRLLGEPAVLSHGPVAYASAPVICAPAMEQLVYMQGGAEYQVKLTATVRKEALAGAAPRQGDRVTVGGELYTVAAVSTTAADPLFTLQLAKHL
ncbi:MAG: hypothetical protein IJA81_09195 [Akkermansia sp.]|nr:hypothetical protein [Akkermansia sp.]